MPKMTPGDLKALLAAEKADALSAMRASKLSDERSTAMDYYLGDLSQDMPAADGRSRAVSTDVADTIEGMMPTLMEIFCGGDEVVKFEPVGPEDVKAAEQETDYVNHVFMQQNPGFLVLYSFVKDALLSKVGIVKVFWEEKEDEERETYFDQPAEALTIIASTPEVEITEHTEHDGLHDFTLIKKRKSQCARVEPVPPEEFGIARNARSIKDAGYCFHEVERCEADLIEEGYDEDQVKKLPSYVSSDGIESDARDTVEESTAAGDDGANKSNRKIKVTEHYVRLDYEGKGKACIYRVTTAGDAGEILKREGELDIVQEDLPRFAAMTPVIITHRFFGRSIADLVMDIQRIKTALIRGALDNLYLHNNPRVEVAEQFAGENTLDDLLVSRPGGIVRTKQPGGLNWQTVPDITPSVYPALQYFDATREWRTGVSRQGQGLDANALQNQSATAANQLFTAAQARIKLIARIFAETGIRDLFSLLHATIRKNGSVAQTVRLRNQWVQVDPREWKNRSDMTINVGLGTGGKEQQLIQMQLLIGAQEKAIAAGLVSKTNLWNSAKELVKLIGRKDPEAFFTPPQEQDQEAQAPIEPPPDPKMAELQMKQQLDERMMAHKEKIELLQAQADTAANDRKIAADIALAERKFELDANLKMIEAEMKREDHQIQMSAKQQMHDADMMRSQEKHAVTIQQTQEMGKVKARQAKAKKPAKAE
jgi:hypothetical protein